MTTIPLSPTARAAADRAEAADAKLLRASLVRHAGAVSRVAEELGVSTDTIHRRIASFGLTEWHRETYPRSARQPRAASPRKNRKST